MSNRQFGFLVGFLFIWLVATQSLWVALAALLVGLIGYGAARVLEGDLDLTELTDRFTSSRR
jgi:HAMP domain-containing protein